MSLSINAKEKEVVKTGPTDYSNHLVSKPIVSTTSIEKKSAGQDWTGSVGVSNIEHPGVFTSKYTGCLIAVEGSRTYNLGDYNSARFGVTLTIPTDPENLMLAYEWATTWISDKIEEAEKQIKS